MPDKALSLANFKFGLDARREALALQPGALLDLVNGHINQGGEVEKRRAFVDITLTSLAAVGSTFGLEEDGINLVVFGSDNLASSFPLGSFPTIYYQRLQHPAVLAGASYDPAKHAMTAIVYSENFNGLIFAAARFADGRVFAYYDAVLVPQSSAGLVLSGLTSVASQSTLLAAQWAQLGAWYATANVNPAGSALNGSTIVKTPVGVLLTPIVSNVSSAGLFAAQQLDLNGAATSGVAAAASFTITAGASGADTFTLTAPKFASGSGTAAVSGGAVGWTSTNTATATAIAAAVNANTILTGYTALSSGANVFVYAPASWGASANGFTLTITLAGLANFGAGPSTALNINVNPTADSVVVVSNTNLPRRVRSNIITAGASGGTAPYTYLWAEAATGSANGITIAAPSAAATQFYKDLLIQESVTGVFKCTVTDNVAATATSTFVSISLENTNNT